jgi:hypothetical protein
VIDQIKKDISILEDKFAQAKRDIGRETAAASK